MSDSELKQRLEQLHRELQTLQDLDDAEQQTLIGELRRDIEHVLARAEQDEHDEGLADRLSDLVERFEMTHPTLASAMGAVADQLARMGI